MHSICRHAKIKTFGMWYIKSRSISNAKGFLTGPGVACLAVCIPDVLGLENPEKIPSGFYYISLLPKRFPCFEVKAL